VPDRRRLAALATHRVDAAFGLQPYLAAAQQAKTFTKLADIDSGSTHPGIPDHRTRDLGSLLGELAVGRDRSRWH
jgi:hypothetical protein